jgi:hypothetical protein
VLADRRWGQCYSDHDADLKTAMFALARERYAAGHTDLHADGR